jgi:hypothetical protein
MRPARAILAIGGAVAFCVLALAGWDFLQLGRGVPPMVPAPERATSIIVEKAARRLTLVRDGAAGRRKAPIRSTSRIHAVAFISPCVSHTRTPMIATAPGVKARRRAVTS